MILLIIFLHFNMSVFLCTINLYKSIPLGEKMSEITTIRFVKHTFTFLLYLHSNI